MARFFPFLLAVSLCTSAAAGAAGQQEHQAGLVAYARGDLLQALAHFRAAREAEPTLVPAHYYEGLTLVDLGRPAEAAEAFGRVLELDPGNLEARIELARVQARLPTAMPGATGEPAAGAAEAPAQRWWALRLSLAGGYDSRALLDPEDGTIPAGAGGGLLDVRGELFVRPVLTDRHRLEGLLGLRRGQYLGRLADDLSFLELSTGGSYRARFPLPDDEIDLRLVYDIGLGWADGGPALADLDGESGFHLQAERHEWTAGVDLRSGGRAVTRASYAYCIHHFAGRLSRFNQRAHDSCLEQIFALADGTLDLEFDACLRWARARSAEYDHIAPRGRVGLALRLGALSAGASAGYEHAKYQQSHSGRRDDRLNLALELGWPFADVWRIGFGWQHWESWSSEDEFEFRRDRAVLQLELEL